ncbi:MAG: DUF2867 domain-containing protein [Saprospiraceae bacterium]|nr:DUF2867 domain-containing protein [Saprospiraceae bacterium]
MKPYECAISANELIGQLPEDLHYADAFAIKVPAEYRIGPVGMMCLFFDSIPAWTKALLAIRETLVGWIGLKTATGIDMAKELEEFQGQEGQAIGLFHVMGRGEEELMVGESDKHLDFWLSFIASDDRECFEMKLATAVVFNGWLGKLYFAPVKPLHRLIVPAVLKRMARNLMEDYQNPAYQR